MDDQFEAEQTLEFWQFAETGENYGTENDFPALKDRTKDFALRVIRLFAALPHSIEAQVIGKQLLRSATSVGAHYREAIRARSDAEFISKIEVGLQELEESRYWMELLGESNIFPISRLQPIHQETSELIAILITCVRKVKERRKI